MKGVILSVAAAIAITASLAYQEYACPAGSIGACCEAYDYVEKQCYRGQLATVVNGTNSSTATTTLYECTATVDIFFECCAGPEPTESPSALVYNNCTPSRLQPDD